MKLFDKLLKEETKIAYITKLEKKYNLLEEEKLALSDYIISQECALEINRLKTGDFLNYNVTRSFFKTTDEYQSSAASSPAFYLPPRQNLIRKSYSEKRRVIYNYAVKDVYLLKYITFVLMDFDALYEDGLCSFRTDNHTKQFFRKIRVLDPQRKKYILQTDFHDFGNSIDQDLALSLIQPLFQKDPEFFRFITWLMTRNLYYKKQPDSEGGFEWHLTRKRVSLVPGNPIGSFFLNIYLRDMDAELSERTDLYMRYGDDIAFFSNDLETALWAKNCISQYADKRHLIIHEKKSSLVQPEKDAEILGIQVLPDQFDIGEFSTQKLIRKIRLYQNKQLRRIRRKKITKEQAMRNMIRFINRSFYGREDKANTHEMNWVMHAFPIITQTDCLSLLDHVSQDAIRICGSGKKTNAKYRITYKQMVNAGYRCLVHSYYHRFENTKQERYENEVSCHNAD